MAWQLDLSQGAETCREGPPPSERQSARLNKFSFFTTRREKAKWWGRTCARACKSDILTSARRSHPTFTPLLPVEATPTSSSHPTLCPNHPIPIFTPLSLSKPPPPPSHPPLCPSHPHPPLPLPCHSPCLRQHLNVLPQYSHTALMSRYCRAAKL